MTLDRKISITQKLEVNDVTKKNTHAVLEQHNEILSQCVSSQQGC
jgi:hypothetical protein